MSDAPTVPHRVETLPVQSLRVEVVKGPDTGKVVRAADNFCSWAREAAQQGGAYFIDLNQIVANRYDALGQEAVQPFFTSADHTHTSSAGGEVNAACVAEGIRSLEGCGLAALLRPATAKVPLQ